MKFKPQMLSVFGGWRETEAVDRICKTMYISAGVNSTLQGQFFSIFTSEWIYRPLRSDLIFLKVA